jgi:diguanylate cyclase (GGDEF)-like protein/PAS domain S-box-containing protein
MEIERKVLIAGPPGGWRDTLSEGLTEQGWEVIRILAPKPPFPPATVAVVDLEWEAGPELARALSRSHPLLPLLGVGREAPQDISYLATVAPELISPQLAPPLLELASAVGALRARLAELEDQTRLFTASPWFGIYVLDQDLNVLYASPYVGEHLKRDPNEFLGRSVLELVHPQHREQVRRVLLDKLAGKEYPPYAIRLLRGDGTPVWVEVYSRRAEAEGRPVIVGLVKEVEAERRRAALQGILLGLVRRVLLADSPRKIIQEVANAITTYCGFRRAVISLYDLRWPDPLEAPVYQVVTSGLTREEEEALLSKPGLKPEQRRVYFSDQFRLGPEAYYIPLSKNPFELDGVGLPGTVELDGWSPMDLLFIPLQVGGRLIGHISVDDPVDPAAPTPELLEPVTQLAAVAALAVERAYERDLRERHERHLAAVQAMAPRLAGATTEPAVIRRAVELVAKELGYALSAGGKLTSEALDPFWYAQSPGGKLVQTREPLAHHPYLDPSRLEGEVIPDAREMDCPLRKRLGLNSMLVVPVRLEEELVGVLMAGERDCHALSELDLDTLLSVASLCATVIQGIRVRARLTGLYDLSHSFSQARDRGELIKLALEALKDAFSFDHSSFFSFRDGDLVLEALEPAEGMGLIPDLRPGWRPPPGRGVVRWVAQHRAPALLADAPSDPRYVPGSPEIRSELAVPVMVGEELFGVLNVESRLPSAFGPRELALLQAIASQLAVALGNMAARQRLQELAIRDPLTGLYNRRFLDEAVEREVAAARRYRRPLAFLYVDVDGFREVNNRLGHLTGDEVLRRVAEFLRTNVREADYVVRIGGDEFLIMIPETDGAVDRVMHRLKERIKGLARELGVAIGLSIGKAIWEPAQQEFDLDKLLAEADKRMYEDKHADQRAQGGD